METATVYAERLVKKNKTRLMITAVINHTWPAELTLMWLLSRPEQVRLMAAYQVETYGEYARIQINRGELISLIFQSILNQCFILTNTIF